MRYIIYDTSGNIMHVANEQQNPEKIINNTDLRYIEYDGELSLRELRINYIIVSGILTNK